MIKEIYIFTNGVLLSRRLITDEAGTPITPEDIATVVLKIYTLQNNNGTYVRSLVSTIPLVTTDVITNSIQRDVEGREYNFRYCIENAFTQPNTLYLAEYTLTTIEGHKIIVVAKGRTMD